MTVPKSPYGVSADGAVVVGYSSGSSGLEAFRWTAQTGMVGLGDLAGGGFDSNALGVSGDGKIVVGTSSAAAFIWDQAAGMQNLQEVLATAYGLDLNGWQLIAAYGVSADGTVIVGQGKSPSGQLEGWVADLRPVPIPAPAWLLGTGLIGLAAVRRKRR